MSPRWAKMVQMPPGWGPGRGMGARRCPKTPRGARISPGCAKMPQRGPQIVLGEPKARVPNLNGAPLFFLGRAQPQFGRYRPADDTFHVFSHASPALSGASRSLPRKVSLSSVGIRWKKRRFLRGAIEVSREGPKIAPRWPQHGPRTAPGRPQDGPRGTPKGTRMAPRCPQKWPGG